MYRRVGKGPEWIGLVGQEVGRDQSILIWPDDLAAERAMGAAGFDSLYVVYDGADLGKNFNTKARGYERPVKIATPSP
jgi:hypothetical protein